MKLSDTKLTLIPGSRLLYPAASDRAAWAGIAPAHRKEIQEMADRYAALPWPVRKATDFLAFTRTGSRKADEEPYFARRRKLCAAILGCCADPGRSPDDVVDGMWMICEESSWVISAHNVNPIPGAPEAADDPLPDPEKPYIDLFCAQTGMILSFACSLLGPELDSVSPVIRRRTAREISRRVLEPFMTHDEFWWMGFVRKDLCNWTPWIVSNVMICAGLSGMSDPELETLLQRGLGMLDRYLDCMPEDGGCDEGAGYWNMAGGALLDCLEMIEKWTGAGWWQDPKIRNVLSFPLKAEIGNGWFLNFADCDARPFLSGERIQLAGEKLHDPALEAMGQAHRGTLEDQLSDVPHLSRALSYLFHPAAEPVVNRSVPAIRAPSSRDVWLPDLQIRLVEKNNLTLCCKGGRNAGSHAHCDTGSFMLYDHRIPEIVDAGNMVYTARTFSDQRHTLWNIRSGYHNLPVIGGTEQGYGPDFHAENICFEPDGLSMGLARAWPKESGLRYFRRQWRLTEDALLMTDDIQLDTAREVVWIFLLRRKPDISPSSVRFGDLLLTLPEGFHAAEEAVIFEDARMLANWPEGRLWRVKISGEPKKSCQVSWIISRASPSC